jgi:hypothetical protein
LITGDIVFYCVNVADRTSDPGLVNGGHQIGDRDCANGQNNRHSDQQFDKRETATVLPPMAR